MQLCGLPKPTLPIVFLVIFLLISYPDSNSQYIYDQYSKFASVSLKGNKQSYKISLYLAELHKYSQGWTDERHFNMCVMILSWKAAFVFIPQREYIEFCQNVLVTVLGINNYLGAEQTQISSQVQSETPPCVVKKPHWAIKKFGPLSAPC